MTTMFLEKRLMWILLERIRVLMISSEQWTSLDGETGQRQGRVLGNS